MSTRINEYLNVTHLNSLMSATGFSGPQTVHHFGPEGEVSVPNVNLLTLQADSLFNGPLEFAAAWKNLQEKLNGKQNIYWQLFFKLAEISGQSPQSLSILITTGKPRIYSILIYYNGGIKVDGPASEIKGGSTFKIITDPGKDFANCSYIPHQPYSAGFKKKLVDSISWFLTSPTKGKPYKKPDIDLQHGDENYIVFRVSGLYGKITPKSYEVIELYLSIGPVENGNVSIGYNFTLHFGSEPYSVTAYSKNYEDGIRSYSQEMAAFNNALRNLIQNIAKANERSK